MRTILVCPPAYAFVVGNDKYDSGALGDLHGCTNDADNAHAALAGNGFRTLLVKDVKKTKMLDLFEGFLQLVCDGDMVVVYFSGHGFNRDGSLYLCPRDAVPGGWLLALASTGIPAPLLPCSSLLVFTF
jgi:uncharacterized caspase-like protein